MDVPRNPSSQGYSLVPPAADDLPPEYENSSCSSQSCQITEGNPQKQDAKGGSSLPEKLPSYELATTLPSYEDTQRSEEDRVRAELVKYFFHLDDNNDEIYMDGLAIGSDCTFIFAFVLAFFFNWLGFFIGYCILLSWSGRCGALSGFGLSLLNWLMYLKESQGNIIPFHLFVFVADCCDALKYSQNGTEYFTEEKLIMWWFFFFAASLLIVKGLVNWFKVRRVLSMTEEERENGRLLVLY